MHARFACGWKYQKPHTVGCLDTSESEKLLEFLKLLTSQTWASIESQIPKTPMIDNLKKDETGEYRFPVSGIIFWLRLSKCSCRVSRSRPMAARQRRQGTKSMFCNLRLDITWHHFTTWDRFQKMSTCFKQIPVEGIFCIFRALCNYVNYIVKHLILPSIYEFLSMSYDSILFKLGLKGSVSCLGKLQLRTSQVPWAASRHSTDLTEWAISLGDFDLKHNRFWVPTRKSEKKQIETNAGLPLQAKDERATELTELIQWDYETNDFNCTISCTSESKADSRLASLVHGLHEHGKVKLPPQFPSFVSALRLVCRLTTAWFTWHQSEGKQCIVFGLYWRLCAVIFYVYTRFMRSGCWSQRSRKAQWRTLVIFLVSWRASKKRKQDSGEQHRASQTVLLRYSFYSDIL